MYPSARPILDSLFNGCANFATTMVVLIMSAMSARTVTKACGGAPVLKMVAAPVSRKSQRQQGQKWFRLSHPAPKKAIGKRQESRGRRQDQPARCGPSSWARACMCIESSLFLYVLFVTLPDGLWPLCHSQGGHHRGIGRAI